jgi:hypothetical protein
MNNTKSIQEGGKESIVLRNAVCKLYAARFAKYRGQFVQYYTQSVLSNPETSGLITITRPSVQP